MATTTVNGVPKTNGVLTNGHAHPAKDHSRSKDPNSYSAKFNLKPHFIGGNHLGVAPAGSVKDFVANHDGHTVITSVSFRDTTFLVAMCMTDLVHRCSLQITVLPLSKR